MSYLVLARKYRPMFFDDVMGQQHVTLTLQNAIQQKRIANAYLFSGPRGVGKTTVARVLAKALNCDQGPSIKPCNQCSSCIEINESRSLDVFEIDGASNRGIDEVRNLREGLRYSPNPGKHRIYIIDEVHMLTNEAFNALLKTLEEPPTNVLFIFATTEAHKVPATILSRCQRFDFKRMPVKSIVEQMKKLCQQEEIEIDDEALRLIAVKADGSMRDSQSVLDQIIAFAGNSIKAKDVSSLLGIIDLDLFFEVTELVQKSDVMGGIQLANRIFADGYDFSEFLLGMQEHLRNFMVVKSTGTASDMDASEVHIQRYQAQQDAFEIEDLLRLVKICADADYLIRRSSNARLHLEVTLVKMIKLNRSVRLSELMEQIEQVKKKSKPLAAPVANDATPAARPSNGIDPAAVLQKSPTAAAQADDAAAALSAGDDPDPISLTLNDFENRWQEITETIKRSKIALGSFLAEGWPTNLQGRRLEVSFDAKNIFHLSSVDKNRDQLEAILFEILGTRLRVVCIKDDAGILEKVRQFPVYKDKKSEFEKLVETESLVKKIVDTFDTELIN